jgi:hypothetical protein
MFNTCSCAEYNGTSIAIGQPCLNSFYLVFLKLT